MSTDFEIIINALKKSATTLLEIKEEGSKVRRNAEKPVPEYTDEYKEEINSRTVHVKRFPLEYEIDQLLEYFKTVGNVENIIMCRRDGKFKGSVFATFKTKEEADEFVAKEEVLHEETKLIRELRPDYHKRKNEQFEAFKEEKKQKKLKKLEKNEDEANEEKVEDDDVEIIKDSVIKLVGMNNETSRENIKEAFADYGSIAWVDSSIGDTEGYVRFENEGSGKEVFDKIKDEKEGKITIKETEVTIELIQGEDEEKYFKKAKAEKMQRRQAKRNVGGRRNKGRRGGYQGRGGGSRRSDRLSGGKRQGSSGDGPPAKQIKTE